MSDPKPTWNKRYRPARRAYPDERETSADGQHVRRRKPRYVPLRQHGWIALVVGVLVYVWQSRYYPACQSFLARLTSQSATTCEAVTGAHVVALAAILGGTAAVVAAAIAEMFS